MRVDFEDFYNYGVCYLSQEDAEILNKPFVDSCLNSEKIIKSEESIGLFAPLRCKCLEVEGYNHGVLQTSINAMLMYSKVHEFSISSFYIYDPSPEFIAYENTDNHKWMCKKFINGYTKVRPLYLSDISGHSEFINLFTRSLSKEKKELLTSILEESNIVFPVSEVLDTSMNSKYGIISGDGNKKDVPKSINRYPLHIGLALVYATRWLSEDVIKVFYNPELYKRIPMPENYHGVQSSDTFFVNNGIGGIRKNAEYLVKYVLYRSIDIQVISEYLKTMEENKMKCDVNIKSEETMLQIIADYERNGRRNK